MVEKEKKEMYEVRQRILQAEPMIYNMETEESIEVAEAIAKLLNEVEALKELIK